MFLGNASVACSVVSTCEARSARGSGPSCMSVSRGWTWQSTQGGSFAPGPPPERVATWEVMPPTRELGAARSSSLGNGLGRHASSASPEGQDWGASRKVRRCFVRDVLLVGSSATAWLENGVSRRWRVGGQCFAAWWLRPCAVCVTDRGRLAVAIRDFRQPAASKGPGSRMAAGRPHGRGLRGFASGRGPLLGGSGLQPNSGLDPTSIQLEELVRAAMCPTGMAAVVATC